MAVQAELGGPSTARENRSNASARFPVIRAPLAATRWSLPAPTNADQNAHRKGRRGRASAGLVRSGDCSARADVLALIER
jgi:hypothetical protein